MFKWLLPKTGKDTSIASELSMRASIANKLRKYDADGDTTISEFSLAEEQKTAAPAKLRQVKKNDAWSQANPREIGKWRKENR
ncbi:MAG: hypothetical protein OEY09_03775 [Gammaproteobacteria bacterium]|nr:hypothetical protein [Gammaproteobacteria bacterium]